MSGPTSNAARRDPIMIRIGRMQRAARWWTLWVGFLAVALLMLIMLFGGVLADHFIALRKAGRMLFLYSFVVATATALTAAMLWPLLARLSRVFVAREIERHMPQLKNSLISYLQCRNDPHVPAEVKRLLRKRAYPHLRKVDVRLLARRERLVRLGSALAATALVFGLYATFSPKSATVSVRRLFAPAAGILAPTRTRIAQIDPGDVWLLQGDPLTVRARITRRRPDAAAVLWRGQTFKDRRLLLSREKDGWWKAGLPAVLESGAYKIVAGDARSEDCAIAALPRPAVTDVRCTISPPSYTGLPKRDVAEGNLTVPAGAQVELAARTTLPPQQGWLQMGSGRRMWMRADPKAGRLSVAWEVNESDSYRIMFETVDYPRTTDPDRFTFRNADPLTYRIDCRADGVPQVRITEPEVEVRVEPDAVVEVVYDARDDYGLTALALAYKIDETGGRRLALPLEPRAREVGAAHQWDLAPLKLRRGNVVDYQVVATDNWPRGPHVGASKPHRLVIGDRAPIQVADAGNVGPEHEPDAEKGDPKPKTDAKEPGEAPPTPKGTERDSKGRPAQSPEEPSPKPDGKGESSEDGGQKGGSKDGAGEDGGAGDTGGSKPGLLERLARALAKRNSEGECPSCKGGGKEGGCESCGKSPSAGGQGQGSKPGASGKRPGDGAGKPGGGASKPGDGAGKPGGGDGEPRDGAGKPGDGAGQPADGAGKPGGGGGRTGTGASDSVADADGQSQTQGSPIADGPLSDEELGEALEEALRLLEDGTLPEEMLKDLGTNREKLKEAIEGFLAEAEKPDAGQVDDDDTEPGADGAGAPGRVLNTVGRTQEGVHVGDAAGKAKRDDVRSRFEDASGRISPRYRDALNAYSKRLAEGK